MRHLIFFADRHYDARCGQIQAELLDDLADIHFIEEDYGTLNTCLERHAGDPHAVLALNAITGTPGNLEPDPATEPLVKAHLEAGKDLWVLHGSSAAFWPWSWWRELMRLRWVRGEDPDGMPASCHPIVPFNLEPTDAGRTAIPGLSSCPVPEDELYINLEDKGDYEAWMTVEHDGRRWPQAYRYRSPWNGWICGWIPGHREEAIRSEGMTKTLRMLASAWLKASGTER